MIALVFIYLYVPCYNYLIFSHIQTLMDYLTFFMSIVPANDCFLQYGEIWGNIDPWQLDGPWKVCFTSCQRSAQHIFVSTSDLGFAVN